MGWLSRWKPPLDEIINKSKWNGDCLEWTGLLHKSGYGYILISGIPRPVHRVQYVMEIGPINGLHVLHKCDNRACINPQHLWLGTHTENVRDMLKKGRARPPRGEKHWKSKLTQNQILKIRKWYKIGISSSFIGKHFNVTSSQALRIAHKQNWKHVYGP